LVAVDRSAPGGAPAKSGGGAAATVMAIDVPAALSPPLVPSWFVELPATHKVIVRAAAGALTASWKVSDPAVKSFGCVCVTSPSKIWVRGDTVVRCAPAASDASSSAASSPPATAAPPPMVKV